MENLTRKDVLQLFEDGLYGIDLEAGTIISMKTRKPLSTFRGNNNNNHGELQEVKLYRNSRRGHFLVSNVIWMVGNRCDIPEDFEIHHRNTNQLDNRFRNLFALHKNDHRKLHNDADLIEGADPDVPF